MVEMNTLNPKNIEMAHPGFFFIKLMDEEAKSLAVVCNLLLQICLGI